MKCAIVINNLMASTLLIFKIVDGDDIGWSRILEELVLLQSVPSQK